MSVSLFFKDIAYLCVRVASYPCPMSVFVLLRVLVTRILHQKKVKDLSLDIVKIDIPSVPNCSSPIPFWDVSKCFSL